VGDHQANRKCAVSVGQPVGVEDAPDRGTGFLAVGYADRFPSYTQSLTSVVQLHAKPGNVGSLTKIVGFLLA